MPSAPARMLSAGTVQSATSSCLKRAFDQPASRNVRMCSGEMTMTMSGPGKLLWWWTARTCAANVRTRLSGVREFWSTTPVMP